MIAMEADGTHLPGQRPGVLRSVQFEALKTFFSISGSTETGQGQSAVPQTKCTNPKHVACPLRQGKQSLVVVETTLVVGLLTMGSGSIFSLVLGFYCHA